MVETGGLGCRIYLVDLSLLAFGGQKTEFRSAARGTLPGKRGCSVRDALKCCGRRRLRGGRAPCRWSLQLWSRSRRRGATVRVPYRSWRQAAVATVGERAARSSFCSAVPSGVNNRPVPRWDPWPAGFLSRVPLYLRYKIWITDEPTAECGHFFQEGRLTNREACWTCDEPLTTQNIATHSKQHTPSNTC